MVYRFFVILLLAVCYRYPVAAQNNLFQKEREVSAGKGWAGNSVNTVIFRKNALTSQDNTQFIAYYDEMGEVILGKRKLTDSSWELKETGYRGRIRDAHNSISIELDGDGYLHLAWDLHGNKLRYARSLKPYSLLLSAELPMTGAHESSVTYPEFYRLPDGELLFLYRDGASGKGNLVVNKYITREKKWIRLHDNLLDGEQKRNAYWQAFVDQQGHVHISWVWRESPDVVSNHDLCYAVSRDGGISWERADGRSYRLPVTASAAEIVYPVSQGSELINQTSMFVNEKGYPVIATYWRGKKGVPQYQLVYYNGKKWRHSDTGFRSTGFTLSGAGTKKIPVSRPLVVGWSGNGKEYTALLFRDQERNDRISVAWTKMGKKLKWRVQDISDYSTGSWEPLIDAALWGKEKKLHVFVQTVSQADAEGLSATTPTGVRVLELKMKGGKGRK